MLAEVRDDRIKCHLIVHTYLAENERNRRHCAVFYVHGFRRDLMLNSEEVNTPSYHPRPLPPPRGPRENPPPRCGPRPRPPPLGGGGPRGRGGFARLAPTPLANLILPRVLPRGAGVGRPRPRDTRDIISSSSGDGGRDHSLSFARDRDRAGGRVSRGGTTVLRFVIMSGSIPFRVNEDEVVVGSRMPLAGQSPIRCFALQQFAQQIDTVTWLE